MIVAREVLLQSPLGHGKSERYRLSFPPVQRPYTEAEIAAVTQVMRQGVKQTQGSYLEAFEKDFKDFIGAKNVFGVNSCSSALKLAAIFCHIKPGDEVIVPAYTSPASALPFGDLGAKIVWGDIHPDTWTLDPKDVLKKITPKTKAVVAVHLLGNPCDIKEIVRLAHAQGILVIEDCAHALDCRVDGQHVGTFGDFGCFSFHGARTVTTLGEGGMFVCRDNETAGLVEGIRCGFSLRDTGLACRNKEDEFLEDCWPQYFCLGEAQCALGAQQLKLVPANSEILMGQSCLIREYLKDIPEYTFPEVLPKARCVPHPCVLHYDGLAYARSRDDLLTLLAERYAVPAAVMFTPLYRELLFQVKGCGEQDCPVLEGWWEGSFTFPWWSGMSEQDLKYLCEALRSAAIELRG